MFALPHARKTNTLVFLQLTEQLLTLEHTACLLRRQMVHNTDTFI